MIKVEEICKTFKVSKRNAGLKHAIRAFFHREYHEVHALDHVSFTINEGEMVGYIGPNGAGKSSTIKVMSGILTPDSGTCIINGRVPWKERKTHVQNIGVVFGQRTQLWWDVPVTDSFELIKSIYCVDESQYKRNYDELVTMLSLSEILQVPTRQLSLGQRMRCEIAASLIHNPALLFLDEPTIGLDAVSKRAVREFILRLNLERGTTVILTTHDMQDIEALTERILLIGHGKILLDGSLTELKKRSSPIKTIELTFRPNTFNPLILPSCVELISQSLGYAVCRFDTNKISPSAAIAALTNCADVTDISVAKNNLEDIIVSLYEEYRI